MQNCSKYVIFIDSIIPKRDKSYNFALLHIFCKHLSLSFFDLTCRQSFPSRNFLK